METKTRAVSSVGAAGSLTALRPTAVRTAARLHRKIAARPGSMTRLATTVSAVDKKIKLGEFDDSTDADFDLLLDALEDAEATLEDVPAEYDEPEEDEELSGWAKKLGQRVNKRLKEYAKKVKEQRKARKAQRAAQRKERKAARKSGKSLKSRIKLRKGQKKERKTLKGAQKKEKKALIKSSIKEHKDDKKKLRAKVDPRSGTVSAEAAAEAAEARAQAEGTNLEPDALTPEEAAPPTSFLWPADKPYYLRPAAIGGALLLLAIGGVAVVGLSKKDKQGNKPKESD